MIKKILLGVLGIVILLVILNFQLVSYGLAQGYGQLRIILNSRPVTEVLKDEGVDDETKDKLRMVQDIRMFAMDQLGLRNSKNYTTLYDQKGEPVLWVVRACYPFQLKNFEWTFPIVGTVSYKGYFNLQKAINLRDKLRDEGYDTYIREVSAWSTLGWFKDPILSNMLDDSPGDMANTIIHELTHATIFVKDSITFNENLASFIGDKGAEAFLTSAFPDSEELSNYRHLKEDRAAYARHFLRGAQYLDSLYRNFPDDMLLDKKVQLKKEAIQNIVDKLDTVSFFNPSYSQRFQDYLPNNAYFMSYLLYRSNQGKLDSLYANNYNNDLRLFISEMKKLHPK